MSAITIEEFPNSLGNPNFLLSLKIGPKLFHVIIWIKIGSIIISLAPTHGARYKQHERF